MCDSKVSFISCAKSLTLATRNDSYISKTSLHTQYYKETHVNRMLAASGTTAIHTNQQHRYWIPSTSLDEKKVTSFQKMTPDEKKKRKKQKSKRLSTTSSSGDEMIVPKGHKKRRILEEAKSTPMEPSSPIDFAVPVSREERRRRSERIVCRSNRIVNMARQNTNSYHISLA